MVGDWWGVHHRPEGGFGEQVEPGLDGGGFQHGVAVSHHRPARISDVINRAWLLLNRLLEDLCRATVAFAGAHRPHHALDEGVALEEVVDHRALAEVEPQTLARYRLAGLLFRF